MGRFLCHHATLLEFRQHDEALEQGADRATARQHAGYG